MTSTPISSALRQLVIEPAKGRCEYCLMHQDFSIYSHEFDPYSGITEFCSASRDFLTFSPDEFYQLSVCGLQETPSKAIASLDLSPSLEFLGAKFDVVNREDDTSSYENLYHTLVAAEP